MIKHSRKQIRGCTGLTNLRGSLNAIGQYMAIQGHMGSDRAIWTPFPSPYMAFCTSPYMAFFTAPFMALGTILLICYRALVAIWPPVVHISFSSYFIFQFSFNLSSHCFIKSVNYLNQLQILFWYQ